MVFPAVAILSCIGLYRISAEYRGCAETANAFE